MGVVKEASRVAATMGQVDIVQGRGRFQVGSSFTVFGIIALFFFLMPSAHAECADPYRKAYEEGVTTPGSDVVGTRLNYYAEGSRICIDKNPLFCPTCKMGKAYECRSNEWEESYELQCDRKRPNKGANSKSGVPGVTKQARSLKPPAPPKKTTARPPVKTEADSDVCGLLGTC